MIVDEWNVLTRGNKRIKFFDLSSQPPQDWYVFLDGRQVKGPYEASESEGWVKVLKEKSFELAVSGQSPVDTLYGYVEICKNITPESSWVFQGAKVVYDRR